MSAALCIGRVPTFAYEVAPVSGGGKIEGKVTFQGTVPIRKIIPTKDREVCGGPRDEPQIRVGAGKGVQDAVVYLKEVPPASVQNPVYSHKLSLVGFWSLALFYPFVGIHHYLYSPIADWAETLAIITSMLLIVPVWTVLQNFFGTMVGRRHTFTQNLTAKFLIMGSLMYLAGCFQGSTEALRAIQQPTHFSDFVISHSHLTVFGTFVVWAIGGTVYVIPRLVARPLWSPGLGNWSFWLITFGISLMGLDLTMAGLQQGYMLMAGVARPPHHREHAVLLGLITLARGVVPFSAHLH
ncbi:cbb3-type cytochrome c oxidase subunit I [Cupriavidus sp. amp6]|uniref:cbb3-type cytochrome c oxidase subunit I n=1 Tax=Cupriavidus sp. amp6 TaxID=388051 RepID=UPI00041D270D|nr:cbb3-type cytochrome c oxidase subunit I [Cupriavidus sp. amp6]